MTAIYHRNSLLDPTKNIIGIAKKGDVLTYNLGNKYINNLCSKKHKIPNNSLYYKKACKNTFVEKSKFDNIINKNYKSLNITYTYPFNNQKNVKTAFFTEMPDPLPNYNSSGNPISFYFNKFKVKNKNLKLTSFKLLKNCNEEIETIFMNKNNDPNYKFDKYTFVIFPIKRLEFNTNYCSIVKYSINKHKYSKKWYFKTQFLNYKLINANLKIVTLKDDDTYYIYFEQYNQNIIPKNLNYKSNIKKINFDISIVEQNIIKLKINKIDLQNHIEKFISLNYDNQNIKIIIK